MKIGLGKTEEDEYKPKLHLISEVTTLIHPSFPFFPILSPLISGSLSNLRFLVYHIYLSLLYLEEHCWKLWAILHE